MRITEQKKIDFERDGFLIISKYFTNEEIEDFQTALKNLIRSSLAKAKQQETTISLPEYEADLFHKGMRKLEEVNHFFVADIYDTLAQVPAFRRIVSKKETEKMINFLMDRDKDNTLYTYTCRCRIDPPSDSRRTYGWHQEVFYSIPRSHFLQTWAPLVDPSTSDNGTIEVCVGSHKNGIAPQSWNEIEGRALQILITEEEVAKYPKKIIEMNVGDLLIFDYRLYHRSGNNISEKVRYSLVGMYHDTSNLDFYSANIKIGFKNESPKDFYEKTFGEL